MEIEVSRRVCYIIWVLSDYFCSVQTQCSRSDSHADHEDLFIYTSSISTAKRLCRCFRNHFHVWFLSVSLQQDEFLVHTRCLHLRLSVRLSVCHSFTHLLSLPRAHTLSSTTSLILSCFISTTVWKPEFMFFFGCYFHNAPCAPSTMKSHI